MSSKKKKIAINGFGRIGRSSFKIAFEKPELEIVAINDLANPLVLAHLLKYDTVYGVFPYEIDVELDGKIISVQDYRGDSDFFTQVGKENFLVINGKRIKIYSQSDPKNLPWREDSIDVVLECTGFFTKDDSAKAHILAGAKRVVISAPASGSTTETFLIGANHDKYSGQQLVSNASCTTNCVSPVVSVLHNEFNILKASLTTVHAVTAGQNIVDGPPSPRKPDMRAARSGAWNMVPTSTGAAKATTEVITDLKDKFDGIAIRVPIMSGSISVITALVKKPTTAKEVNEALIKASKKPFYKDALAVTYEPLVSSDIIGSTYSSIVDLTNTSVVDKDLVRVLSWYDNEWGYSNRLVEMALITIAD